MNYLIINNHRYNLTDDGINFNTMTLDLVCFNPGLGLPAIIEDFDSVREIVIYGCIVQEDGRETDEFISQIFDKQNKLQTIAYNLDDDTYKVTMIEPDLIEQRIKVLENDEQAVDNRLTTLEKKSEELPPLISPFTTNLEPTGVATRYYEKDELIAIYNNGLPVTVKATMPISYKQPIIINLNCELYLGGN